ncbi:hypothetical protein BHM03_00031676 [Ensete ventricosum]|nr:hypothetical protein BHM03_00031676 [Ensete ventricosum]
MKRREAEEKRACPSLMDKLEVVPTDPGVSSIGRRRGAQAHQMGGPDCVRRRQNSSYPPPPPPPPRPPLLSSSHKPCVLLQFRSPKRIRSQRWRRGDALDERRWEKAEAFLLVVFASNADTATWHFVVGRRWRRDRGMITLRNVI